MKTVHGVQPHRILSVEDHDRGLTGMTWVYPVLSRRAGGVSIGINLNPNNACNWRCIYCQVPGLTKGSAPAADFERIRSELQTTLDAIVHGNFLEEFVPPGSRRLADIAFSGNGEPTTCRDLSAVVELVGAVLESFELRGRIPVVLITNGSMLHRPSVQEAVRSIARLGGEIWFKLDSATSHGSWRINGTRVAPARHVAKLEIAAGLCPTWIQTCCFSRCGLEPSLAEQEAYLECLRGLCARQIPVKGVLLYTLARPSLQPEATELAPLPGAWLDAFAARISECGMAVRVSSSSA